MQTDKAGYVQLIARADGSKTIPQYSESEKDTKGHGILVGVREEYAGEKAESYVKKGDKLVLADGKVELQNFMAHKNGNVSYEVLFDGRSDGATIVRGDGGVLLTGGDRPKYQFDDEGRLSEIASSGKLRQFAYIGKTTELAKVTVQNERAHPGLTFTHELLANSRGWGCTDQYNRPWSAPQGVHHLDQSTGAYTLETNIGQGYDRKHVFQVNKPDGNTEFQQIFSNNDGTHTIHNFQSDGKSIGEPQVKGANNKSVNNLLNAWENTRNRSAVSLGLV